MALTAEVVPRPLQAGGTGFPEVIKSVAWIVSSWCDYLNHLGPVCGGATLTQSLAGRSESATIVKPFVRSSQGALSKNKAIVFTR